MLKQIDFTLPGPICKCDEWKTPPQGKPWTFWTVDGYLTIKCTICNTELKSRFKARILYDSGTQGNRTVARHFTPEDAQLVDQLMSVYKGKVMHVFEDGYAWLNLKTTDSEYEKRLMDHCASTKSGVLWSLRKPDATPCVTITVDSESTVIYAKGKKNSDVAKKYVKYITALVELGLVKGIADDVTLPDTKLVVDDLIKQG